MQLIFHLYMNLVVIEENKSWKAVSHAVWVWLKAVIVEKTIIEEWIDNNCSNDNYN